MCHEGIPAEATAQRAITGGICEKCLSHFGTQAGTPLLEFLDRLDVPILLANNDGEVALVNQPLQAMLGKNLSQIKGKRGGDVFECAYARLPGGCGKTVHCSGCAIRRAVTETFLTGKSLRHVHAHLNRDMVTQILQLGLVISTEKAWGMVLLRIDHVGPEQESGRQDHRH